MLGTQIVEQSVTAELNLVRQEMLGRAKLERVIATAGLDVDASAPEQRQILIEMLQRDIVITSSSENDAPSWQQPESQDSIYEIVYQNSNPQIALSVVDTLLNILVEDTYSATSDGSENVRSFLEREEHDYAARLADAENRLAQFRRDNFDRLPSTQESYFERLQRETEELDDARQNLSLARSRRDRINQSLRAGVPLVGTTSSSASNGDREPMTRSARIQEQEARLEELKLRYTDRHPEVLAVSESIAELRRLQMEELNAMVASGSGPIDPSNPVYQQLQISLNEAQAQIAELEADVASREGRVESLRSRVDEVPEVEAQLQQLMRGYDVLAAQHAAILQSIQREQLSRGAHESERVEFVIIDPPVVGTEPVAPNRRMLMLLVLMVSFGAAGGGAYVLAQLRPIFQDPTRHPRAHWFAVAGYREPDDATQGSSSTRVDVALLAVASLALVSIAVALVVTTCARW